MKRRTGGKASEASHPMRGGRGSPAQKITPAWDGENTGESTIRPAIGIQAETLSGEELRKIDAYWRAANYLSVGQIYLYDNPLLTQPLRLDHITLSNAHGCREGRCATRGARS